MEERHQGLDPQQHERLCAWFFEEMAVEERAAFEAEMATDAALQAERDLLERTVGLVRGLGDGEGPTLSAERRAELVGSVHESRPGFARYAAAAAVLVAVGGGAFWWVCQEDVEDVPQRETAVAMVDAGELPAPTVVDSRENVVADPSNGPQPVDVPGSRGDDSAATIDVLAGQPELRFDEVQVVDQTLMTTPFVTVLDPNQKPAADPLARWGQLPSDSESKESAFDSTAWNRSIGLGTIPSKSPFELGRTTLDALVVGGAGRGGSGGAFRGPGDVAVPDSLRAFFNDGGDADIRARVQNLYGVQPDPDVEPLLTVVRRFADQDVGEVAGYIPPQTFDPDEFFRYCRPRNGERPRDMYFRFWGDNTFVLTRSDALATFAADVDTASYVLARRYLRDGVLPEKAQIRTEEFVNYFDPDLAPPDEGDFAIHTELASSPFGGSSARYLLRVGLRARVIPVEQREPLALTFVVDTSGSMKEDQRLELVKHALMTLVSKLDARDRIGIVAFSNEARLVLPLTDASKTAEIAAIVQGLHPEGSTNAEAGLKLGYELAATGLDPEAQSRVVFLSDGVANVGQTDQDRIAADVVERRESGILLNTIGVGMDNHNDVFLEQLADNGDGVCDYVDDARAVHRAIVERFTGAFQPVAADVKIQVEFDDGQVLRWRQIGYENRAVADQDFRNDAVDAGEVGSGHQVTALFELETALTPDAVQAADDASWATVRVRWLPPRRVGDDPAKREATEIEQRVDLSAFTADFDAATPGFRRAALVAQFAEVLRRSTHAMGDSYAALKDGIQQLVLLPEFATDEDTVELVTLVQRAEELGITKELDRSDLAKACDEYKRHQYLRQQVAQLEGELRQDELQELRQQNDRLEERIRELIRRR